MARAGRERKPGKRTSTGQLSREGRAAAEALSPAMLNLLKSETVRSLHNPLWGTQIGIMHLKGEITLFEMEAGKRWANLARRYRQALGAKGVKPVNLERVGASCEYDPDSEEGRLLSAQERDICDDFEAALEALHEADRSAVFAVRMVCEDDQVLSWAQKSSAKLGLAALARHWGLTNQTTQRRK